MSSLLSPFASKEAAAPQPNALSVEAMFQQIMDAVSKSVRACPPPAAPPHVLSGVHLLVGVNSDEQCEEHKNMAVMNHAERCATSPPAPP